MRDKEGNRDVRGAGNWAPEEQVSAEASAWLTSGAAGAAAGIAPPMGMSPTSWILSVFCRDRGERSQKLAVTPKQAQGRAWRSLAPGSTLSTTDQPPPPPQYSRSETPAPDPAARPGRGTFRSSLRSEISRSVRLAMSWTSCWILGGYSLGALSRGAPARASPLRWLLHRISRTLLMRGTCCLDPIQTELSARHKRVTGSPGRSVP